MTIKLVKLLARRLVTGLWRADIRGAFPQEGGELYIKYTYVNIHAIQEYVLRLIPTPTWDRPKDTLKGWSAEMLLQGPRKGDTSLRAKSFTSFIPGEGRT